MRTPQGVTSLFITLLLCVASFVYIPQYRTETTHAHELSTLLTGSEAKDLGARVKSANCGYQGDHGALPDPACTPGAVFPDATPAQFCVAGYTKTVRNVSTKLRREVYTAYDIPYPQPRGNYEVDHLIPLAIGGSNDIANLFPQPASPEPGFREKDVVEVYLQEEICAGHIDMKIAQEQIAQDWLSIYNNLDPATITRIRAKYRSWSN